MEKQTSLPVPGMLRSASSLTAFYWDKVKAQIKQAHAYLFPPNIDFKGSAEAEYSDQGGAGAGEKVKEAVAKSLEKTKETVEGSARSAAETLKRGLSHGRHPQLEL